MRLTEVYKEEIKEARYNLDFTPTYIAIDKRDGEVWLYEHEPNPTNPFGEGECYDCLGLLKYLTKGEYDKFEEKKEYIRLGEPS